MTLLPLIDLVKDPAITKMFRLHFVPAAKVFDVNQRKVRETGHICRVGQRRIPTAIVVLKHYRLTLGRIQKLQISGCQGAFVIIGDVRLDQGHGGFGQNGN